MTFSIDLPGIVPGTINKVEFCIQGASFENARRTHLLGHVDD
ncbi:MAG: hypothetical protein ACREOJ_04965 [Gemmatimonadaceae bacterium]